MSFNLRSFFNRLGFNRHTAAEAIINPTLTASDRLIMTVAFTEQVNRISAAIYTQEIMSVSLTDGNRT